MTEVVAEVSVNDVDISVEVGSNVEAISAQTDIVIHDGGGGGGGNVQASKSVSYTPSETAISDTVQPDEGYDSMAEVAVSVGAIPDDYVGSSIDRNDSTDMMISENNPPTVLAPAGYYANDATLTVPAGTAGTPSAQKGTVSNHAVAITPKVTNAAGWVAGGTKSGTPVTVEAIELVSGNKAITENGDNIDVTEYATVSVNVSGGGQTLPAGYTACDYVESDCSAYIDTGFAEIAGTISGIEMKIKAYNAGARTHSFVGYQGVTSTSAYRFLMRTTTSNGIEYFGAQSGTEAINGWNPSGENVIKVSFTDNSSKPVFNVNGTTMTGTKNYTQTAQKGQGNMYLCSQNYQGGGATSGDKTVDGSYMRIYYCKFFCFGGCVRDFVPCVRDADSVAGLYDFISEAFYPSIGDGSFTSG